MKKFFDKIYCFSRCCSRTRLSSLSLKKAKKYKFRSLEFIVSFTRRNFFISFFNKKLTKSLFNVSANSKNLIGGSQASRKVIYLMFQQMKKKLSGIYFRDMVISLKGQSWLKKKILGSFFSYWGLQKKRFDTLQPRPLNSFFQLLLIKINNKKAFNGCRVRKQKN